MKRESGKLLGVLATIAALGLAYFELRDGEVAADGWFWLFVALFLLVLGVVELASKKPIRQRGV